MRLDSVSTLRHRLIGLGCLCIMVGSLVALGGWSRGWWHARVSFITYLPQHAGVTKNSPVTVQGFQVGRVREVKLVDGPDGVATEIQWWISSEHAHWVREGVEVKAQRDLLGGSKLAIVLPAERTAPMAAGSLVPGVVEADLMEQILAFQPVIQDLIGQVSALLASVHARTEQLEPLLAVVEQQISTLGRSLEAVEGLTGDARALLADIRRDQAVLVGSLQQSLRHIGTELLPTATAMLQDNRDELQATLASLQRTLGEVEQALPPLLAATNETLTNTRDVTYAMTQIWPFRGPIARQRADEAPAQERPATSAPSRRLRHGPR